MLLLLLAAILFHCCNSFVFRNSELARRVISSKATLLNLFTAVEGGEVDEDTVAFKDIALRYLENKFKDCRGDECRMFCTKDEVSSLMRNILPPLTSSALEEEVNSVLAKMGETSDDIDAQQFIEFAAANSYWEEAGPLVVKELIFLDCLHTYYYEKRSMVEDDDYNALKEQLTWEGSSVSSMKGLEANFITAVAAHMRGAPFLSDGEYNALKQQLTEQKSWVVARGSNQDGLEKLGLQTFLGYLHRSLEKK